MDADERERDLRGTRFAADLRQQLEGLGAHAPEPRRRRRVLVAAVALGAAAAALFAGVSLGTDSASHRPEPKVIYSDEPGSPTPYATNAAGQTFGGAQEGPEADLQSVVAHRGEKGYCWKSDLDGPFPINHAEVEWFMAVQSRREVAVYRSDGVTQVGIFIVGGGSVSMTKADGTTVTKELPNRIAERPPAWLFETMKDMASQAGDANAWAWWARTTAERAAAVTGQSTAGMSEPERPVYVALLLGDFTNWLWSLRPGATKPEYSWIFQIIDPNTHHVFMTGAGAKPFQAAEELELNIAGLRDRITF